jgi:hypothetical protein
LNLLPISPSKRIDPLKVYYLLGRETTIDAGLMSLRITLIAAMFAAVHEAGFGTKLPIAALRHHGRY